MSKDKNTKEEFIAEIEDPSTGDVTVFIGVSEEDVNNQIADLYDYGLDEDGKYVGEEAD